MAKKKTGLAGFRKRHRKRRKAKNNPPVVQDFTDKILPAVGGYAVSRFVARVVRSQIQKRWPQYSKHAGLIASGAAFGTAYYGAHKIEALKTYHDPIMIGSGVALVQTALQTYGPSKYTWLISDYKEEDYAGGDDTEGETPQGKWEPADLDTDDVMANLGDGDLGTLMAGENGSLGSSNVDALDEAFDDSLDF